MDRLSQLEKEIVNIQKELLTIEQLRRRMNNMESWISANLGHVNPIQPRPANDALTTPAPVPLPALRKSPNVKDMPAKGSERIPQLSKNEPHPTVTKVTKELEARALARPVEDKDAVGKPKPKLHQQPNNITKSELDKIPNPVNHSDSLTCVKPQSKPEALKVSTIGLRPLQNLQAEKKNNYVPPIKITKINTQTVPYEPRKANPSEITSTAVQYVVSSLPESRTASTLKTCVSTTGDGNEETLTAIPPSTFQICTNNDGISSTTPTKPINEHIFCKKCMVQFPNATIYTQHKFKVHQKFNCRFCNKKFEEFAFLKQHESAVHHKPKIMQKQKRMSNGKQPEMITLRQDIFVPTPTQPQQQGSTNYPKQVIKQLGGHHLNNDGVVQDKVHSCNKCLKTFKHTKHLKQHMQTHQECVSSSSTNFKQAQQCHFDMNGNFVVTNTA